MIDKKTYTELKEGGFMRQVQENKFALRLRVVGGQMGAEQIAKVSEIANKYGKGYVHMTSRQGIEIPFIDINDVNEIKEELKKVGLQPGACGPRVRTITACQGNAICSSGLIETSNLAKELDEKYFGMELPHKFKIGITGCRNNCLKAEENDLGIKGGVEPDWNKDNCTFCGVCKAVCPTGAIDIDKNNSDITCDKEKCIYCGKCIKSCPVDAWTGTNGYIISFGGTFGNILHFGNNLIPLVTDKEDLFKIVEATIDFFKEHGRASERFRPTLNRVGEDKLKEKIEAVLNK